MNVEDLHVVLQQSFSPDAAIRQPAEATIKNLKNQPGSVPKLLTVTAEKQVRFEVRQAAAIQVKNICRECWAPRQAYPMFGETSAEVMESISKRPILSDEDKAIIKQALIATLLDEPEKSVRDLLAETLHTVVVHEFPDSWPDLLPNLLTALRDGVAQLPTAALRVHNALAALRKICKRYEYKSRDQRGPLNEIVQAVFPMILPLGQQMVQEHSLEAAMMLKLILKIFWSSTQFYLPGPEPTQQQQAADPSAHSSIGFARPDILQPWFDLLTASLDKPLPEANTGLEPQGQPIPVEERNAWPWWKVKKWTVQIMSRLFSRYGFANHVDDAPAKNFALYFSQQVAPQFLRPVLQTLQLRPSGQFCTDRVVHLCLSFLTSAIELSATYKLLKPHLDFLLYQVCFPVMCLSQEDIQSFENDPVEFVHKQASPLADFYDPRLSAITLVKDMVKHRGQDVTSKLLSHMTEILHRYNAVPVEQKNHIEKDGALLTFGSLAKALLAKDKYASQLEGLLLTSVFPDYNSPVGFLRYRACWMAQQFAQVKWTDDGTRLRQLLEMILQRLSDPALPVQIEASKAIRYLIEAEGADAALLPVLPQILTEYFRIMNEIGNDEVVSALQVLLDKFGPHIEPHAVQLVEQLTKAFDQYCMAGDEDDDDDAALAAAQCLECIATVLKGVCNQETMLQRLEPLLMPLVCKILGNDGDFIEYLECGIDILSFLTYFQSQISPSVWQAFPLLYAAFDQWAYDYLNMMVPCFQSYIIKGPEALLAGYVPEVNSPYLELIIAMVSKTVANDRASEMECRYALSLLMCILHNLPGRMDVYLPHCNEIALGKLGQQLKAEVPLTRISVYQVLGSALYYNPQLELLEMEKRAVTGQVFQNWMRDTAEMDRWWPRKTTILGFASIFKLPTQAMPQSIVSIIPELLTMTVQMAVNLDKESEKKDKDDAIDAEKEDANLFGEEDFGDLDQGVGEDEDVKNAVDEAYRKAIYGLDGMDDGMAKFLMGDWDEDEDVDEDYESPLLEPIDPLIFVSDVLQVAMTNEPQPYQLIQNAMSPEALQACQRLFEMATARRAQQS